MLIRGDQLNLQARREVLTAYVNRFTKENKHNHPRLHESSITDEEWLKRNAFYVTNSGRLDKRYNHCEPAFMIDEEKGK